MAPGGSGVVAVSAGEPGVIACDGDDHWDAGFSPRLVGGAGPLA